MIQQKIQVLEVSEPWAKAKLVDGAIVEMRAIFVEVFQVLNDDGTPMYVNNDGKTLAYGVNHQVVVSVTSPSNLILSSVRKIN